MLPLHCIPGPREAYQHAGICDQQACSDCPPHPADAPEEFQEAIRVDRIKQTISDLVFGLRTGGI